MNAAGAEVSISQWRSVFYLLCQLAAAFFWVVFGLFFLSTKDIASGAGLVINLTAWISRLAFWGGFLGSSGFAVTAFVTCRGRLHIPFAASLLSSAGILVWAVGVLQMFGSVLPGHDDDSRMIAWLIAAWAFVSLGAIWSGFAVIWFRREPASATAQAPQGAA